MHDGTAFKFSMDLNVSGKVSPHTAHFNALGSDNGAAAPSINTWVEYGGVIGNSKNIMRNDSGPAWHTSCVERRSPVGAKALRKADGGRRAGGILG